jgi:hypothetical protein
MNLGRPGHPVALLPAVAVIALVLLVLHTGTHPPPRVQVDPIEWSSELNATNGIVSTHRSVIGPSVGVTPATSPGDPGIFSGLIGLQELGASGAIISAADFSEAGWIVVNQSTPTEISSVYSAVVPVYRPTNPLYTAAVDVAVDISAPGGSGVNATAASEVTLSITVAKWPWIHPTDSLAMLLSLAPGNATGEHLSAGATNTMEVVANATGDLREYFAWSAAATVTDPSGDVFQLVPAAAVTLNNSSTIVELVVPGGTPGFVDLQYGVVLGLPVTNPEGSLPTVVVAEVVVVGGALGTAAVAVMRWTWNRPPALGAIPEKDG